MDHAEQATPKRLTYTVAEAAQVLGVSRNSAYDAVHNGQIPAVRLGGRYLIPRVAVEKLLGIAPAAAQQELSQ